MDWLDRRTSIPWGTDDAPSPDGAATWGLGNGFATQALVPEAAWDGWPTMLGQLPHPFAGDPNPYNDPLGPTDALKPFSDRWNATDPWVRQVGGPGDAPQSRGAYEAAGDLYRQMRDGAQGLVGRGSAAGHDLWANSNLGKAEALADATVKEADAMARDVSGPNEKRYAQLFTNGPVDAWRHAEWMRRVASEVGPRTAWLAGTGHEAKGILDTLLGGDPPLRQRLAETIMDLHNNRIGREAAARGAPPFSLNPVVADEGTVYHLPSDPQLMVIGNEGSPRFGEYVSRRLR